jgi:hypothetical protein
VKSTNAQRFIASAFVFIDVFCEINFSVSIPLEISNLFRSGKPEIEIRFSCRLPPPDACQQPRGTASDAGRFLTGVSASETRCDFATDSANQISAHMTPPSDLPIRPLPPKWREPPPVSA